MYPPHPKDYLEPEEYSKLISKIIEQQTEFWKNAPRVVYDRVNNDINVRCGDHYVWNDKKGE